MKMGKEGNNADHRQRKTFMTSVFYEDRLDLIKKVLILYNAIAELKKWPTVFPRHMDIVAYYLCYDYSEDTKKRFMSDFGKSQSSVSVMDSELKSRGLLMDEGGNYKTRYLCDRLKVFRSYFAAGDDPMKVIQIVLARSHD